LQENAETVGPDSGIAASQQVYPQDVPNRLCPAGIAARSRAAVRFRRREGPGKPQAAWQKG
jgi:hypothetical protein